ncbi:MAG TPA: chromate efflux transporter [Cytophagaceae bacterium]|nr:chromate efflux transporter [Cytophagaceae bacterium]
MSDQKLERPTFREALLFWIKLGFISFGGPTGQIAMMYEFLVEKKKWISDSKFLNALNYCMILPGPEAQQLAIYIGWLLHGIFGGLVAGILFVLPSVFILLGLSTIYVTFGSIPWIYALFDGLKPAVIAIVLQVLIKIGQKSLTGTFHYAIAAISFVAIFFLKIPFPVIVFSAIIIGMVLVNFFFDYFKKDSESKAKYLDEDDYYLNSKTPNKTVSIPSLVKQFFVSLALWVTPFFLFYFFTKDFSFWKKLSLFFTQAALITVGGAYAVLPYVAQVTVEEFHWLSSLQMIDGLALGETTPGPLIMVLAFVGFMAGYNHYGHSILSGALGLLTTTFYTFLPSFVFIFVGAPLIEKLQHNKKIKITLSLVTAAIVGVILNLAVYFADAVIFPKGLDFQNINYFALIWSLTSFVAMYRFKIGMIPWIGVSALAGLSMYLFQTYFRKFF